MKRFALFLVFLGVALGVSCERHSWEETKVLHHHGGEHDAHGDAHGDGDAPDGDKGH